MEDAAEDVVVSRRPPTVVLVVELVPVVVEVDDSNVGSTRVMVVAFLVDTSSTVVSSPPKLLNDVSIKDDGEVEVEVEVVEEEEEEVDVEVSEAFAVVSKGAKVTCLFDTTGPTVSVSVSTVLSVVLRDAFVILILILMVVSSPLCPSDLAVVSTGAAEDNLPWFASLVWL